nr:patatin-like phospholipase family protein [uncultured Cetobacterium sp.]
MYRFLVLLLTTFYFSLTTFSYTIEDLEIQKLRSQIRNIEAQIEKLKDEKIENLKKKNVKPKVGLVLSGGGAKGFAHIGVLKALEKNNIKVDYITGTSMGALIGSLYSAGYSPDQIEKLILDIDWENTFDDKPNQEDIPLEQRSIMKDYNLSLKYDDSFNFDLPKSLRNTQKIYLTLKNLLWGVEGINNFDNLPIPMRVIATDLNTGKAKSFKSGDLAQAIVASISIPTIFDPVNINNSYYVDGLLSRNFPVKDAFDLGADIVIGVDVGTTVQKKDSYDIFGVADQIIAIQSASSTEDQRDLATILIEPDVSNYRPTDFQNFKKLEELGIEATNKKINEIKQFNIESNKIYNRDTKINKDSFYLENLLIYNKSKNLSHRNIVKSIFSDYMNEYISPETMESIILKIYSLNFVNKVYYTFNGTTLNIEIEEVPTNIIGLGFNYLTDYGSTFSIGTDISSSGKIGSLSTAEAKFGDYLGFNLKNFSYYGLSSKIGILTSLSYNEYPFFLYDSSENKVGSYIGNNFKFQTAFITQYSNLFLFSYGLSFNYAELNSDVKNKTLDSEIEYSKSYGDVFLRIDWDKTNSSAFPSKGYKGSILQRWGGNLGEDDLNFLTSTYILSGYVPVTNNFSLNTKIFGGNVSGEDVLPDKYLKLGGITSNLSRSEFAFNGYRFQEKYISSLFAFSLGAQYKLVENLYLGGSWDVGTYKFVNKDLSEDEDSKFWDDYYQGFGLTLNYSSIIGPIQLSLSRAQDSNDLLFQLNFGYKFDY